MYPWYVEKIMMKSIPAEAKYVPMFCLFVLSHASKTKSTFCNIDVGMWV